MLLQLDTMIQLNGLIKSVQRVERISCLLFLSSIISVRRLEMIVNDHLISLFNHSLVCIHYLGTKIDFSAPEKVEITIEQLHL